MPRIFYDKLIRDRIPEIIAQSGKSCRVESMTDDEYELELAKKLVEEAGEVEQADNDHIKTELADLLEVVDALLVLKGISRHSLRAEQRRRRSERGGFEKRIKLLWTE